MRRRHAEAREDARIRRTGFRLHGRLHGQWGRKRRSMNLRGPAGILRMALPPRRLPGSLGRHFNGMGVCSAS
jgi:hypothetical protein